MPAFAFSNNDIVVIAWTYDRRLPDCLGFAIHRIEVATDKETVLPALARFKSTPVDARLTTADAPIQKFWWKDLGAERGVEYRYRIEPRTGTPGNLTALLDADVLVTNTVTLGHHRPPFRFFFNRGIVAAQAVSREIGTLASGKPDLPKLLQRIRDPQDTLRLKLSGELVAGLTRLLNRADDEDGTINGALYELNDTLGLEPRLQAADQHGDPHNRTIILGNEATDATDDADADNRQALKDANVGVVDRLLKKGQIPHNKFLVLSTNGEPTAVLTGSTNWTSTGLCTQTNNALIVESPAVARQYLEYWGRLKDDVEQAAGVQESLQGADLRTQNRQHNEQAIANPTPLEDGSGTVEILFSPNTDKLLRRPPKEHPVDMEHVFDLVRGAKQAILFLAFDPGSNSILDAAGRALRDNPNLFVRGALTNQDRASNFAAALRGEGGQGPGVAVVGEPGQPPGGAAPAGPVEPDFRCVPAGAVTKNDAFGAWEAELQAAGHAIIHDKIVVIDPFSDDCVIITGSHNLGFRASHNNDENMVIVRGHKPLAEAYACHVLDLYDHYAWRFLLQRSPETFGRPLDETDGWQDRYINGADETSPELRFWLNAAESR